jgi:hypothetical protein
VNSDPSGLCRGCGARIDREFIERQLSPASDVVLERPRLVLVAVGLLVSGMVLHVVAAIAGGSSLAAWVYTIPSLMVTSWFVSAFLDGNYWARNFYLALTLGGFLFGVLTWPSAAPFMLRDPLQLMGLVVAAILIFPSVSDWFRLRS